MRPWRLALLLGMLPATYPAAASAAAAPHCESAQSRTLLDQVPALRAAHNFPGAAAIVLQALKIDGDSPRARYDQSLIEMDQSANNPVRYKAALDAMTKLADSLPDYAKLSKPLQACPENAKLYTIFNTLGTEMYSSGRKPQAERYFLRGIDNKAVLSNESWAKANYNLGVYYSDRLNFEKAQHYYGSASAAGNQRATAQLHVLSDAGAAK